MIELNVRRTRWSCFEEFRKIILNPSGIQGLVGASEPLAAERQGLEFLLPSGQSDCRIVQERGENQHLIKDVCKG